jgi:uncharacterized membrane protein YqjE
MTTVLLVQPRPSLFKAARSCFWPSLLGSARGMESTERSVTELMQQASQQTGKLVRQEIRLAQLELREKGKRAGLGAGMFGGAGLVALYGVGALVAALILLIGTAVAPWLAGLIVGALLLAAAGGLALTGKQQVRPRFQNGRWRAPRRTWST